MTPTCPPAVFPDAAEGSALESVPEVAVDVLGSGDPAGSVGGEAIVPTSFPPPPKGKQGRWLQQGVAIQRIKGRATRDEIVRLHVFEGMSLRDVARKMNRHYRYVCLVWQGVVKESAGEAQLPEEHRQAVRAYCDKHLRKTIESAQGLIGEAAAYGAVVVAGVKALAELHGLKPEEIAPEGLSLEDVGRQVRVVSPLLIDKLERVRAITGVSADRAAAREAREAEKGDNL